MSMSIDDLKDVSNEFDFVDTNFSSEEVPEFGLICKAAFALTEYSRTGKSSGEWIIVRVKDNSIEVAYKTEGSSGNADERTSLPSDATKDDIEGVIKEYV